MISCGVLAGGSAAAAVLAAWRWQWQCFMVLRVERRIERSEREIERLFVVLLRHLRLPIRDLRQKADLLAGRIESKRKVVVTVGAGEQDERACQAETDAECIRLVRGLCDKAADLDRVAAGLVRLGKIRKVESEPELLDMGPIVVKAAGGLNDLIEQTGAAVEMMDLPEGMGDPELVGLLWHELIANALQNLSEWRKGRIRIWGWVEGVRSMYCVEDNGIGIAEDELEKIFELFYRVDPAVKRQGLGLAVVRRIVEKLHGRLWISSTPGQGSQFTFSLPR